MPWDTLLLFSANLIALATVLLQRRNTAERKEFQEWLELHASKEIEATEELKHAIRNLERVGRRQ